MCKNCHGVWPVSDREHKPKWAKVIDTMALVFVMFAIVAMAGLAFDKLAVFCTDVILSLLSH